MGEKTTPLYRMFKERLKYDYRDFPRVISDLDKEVLFKFQSNPLKTACSVFEACRNSIPFKQACCLLCKIYRPWNETSYEDMLKELCKVWFSVDPEELSRIINMRQYLFQHFYEGNLYRPRIGGVKIEGMHWGCKFWQTYRESHFKIYSANHSPLVNFSSFTYWGTPPGFLLTKSLFFGVSIPFEMSVIFPMVCYDLRYFNFTLNDVRLRLILQRDKLGKLYTAYFIYF